MIVGLLGRLVCFQPLAAVHVTLYFKFSSPSTIRPTALIYPGKKNRQHPMSFYNQIYRTLLWSYGDFPTQMGHTRDPAGIESSRLSEARMLLQYRENISPLTEQG